MCTLCCRHAIQRWNATTERLDQTFSGGEAISPKKYWGNYPQVHKYRLGLGRLVKNYEILFNLIINKEITLLNIIEH
jgi:hypothetical protein